jgi:subtilase family serine protease
MIHKLSKIGACLASLVLFAVPAMGTQTLHGHVPAAVARFNLQPVAVLPAATPLHMAISLPFRNPDTLAKLVKDVQNPASPNYRHFLTPKQFDTQFGATEADYEAVLAWARAHNLAVTHTFPGHTLVNVDGAVADVEKALHLHERVYQHPTEARTFYAPDAEPTLDLQVPVLAVSGLDNFVKPHAKYHYDSEVRPRGGSYGGGSLFMGSDFVHAFAPNTTLNGSGQVVGLLEFDGYTPGDITAYETTAGLRNIPVQEVLLNSVTNDPDNGDAAPPLDVEMAISMAQNLSKVVFYYGSDFDTILTEMADPTQGEPIPSQLSSSWGNGTDGGTYNCFVRLVVQGQSYFYASGDSGALPVDPNGPNGTYINGADPSDLVTYMTQVGGTNLSMNGLGVSYQSEAVWGATGSNTTGGPNGSSGGIQTTVTIPDYQQPVNMSAVGGSTTHRDVPDVAMPADYILVVVTGTNGKQNYSGVAGTSCAAPLWAGFTALANQQATSEGKPTIGFANPAIYDIAQSPLYATCFHDITTGNNTWSGSPSEYYAAKGYDLCTGWGSPNGLALINALAGFSGPVFVDFNYSGSPQNGNYDTPYNTIANGVSGVTSGGTIIIKTAGSSTETPTISKPMTITASDGAATIGQ